MNALLVEQSWSLDSNAVGTHIVSVGTTTVRCATMKPDAILQCENIILIRYFSHCLQVDV